MIFILNLQIYSQSHGSSYLALKHDQRRQSRALRLHTRLALTTLNRPCVYIETFGTTKKHFV